MSASSSGVRGRLRSSVPRLELHELEGASTELPLVAFPMICLLEVPIAVDASRKTRWRNFLDFLGSSLSIIKTLTYSDVPHDPRLGS